MTCFIHHIPGRLRVKIPARKHQDSQTDKIGGSFSGMQGINKVSVNPLTGSIVIYYDPAIFSVTQLLNILQYNEVIGLNQSIVFEKPISEQSTQMGFVIGKAVFSWAVGKVLERSGLGFLAAFI